MTGAGRRALVVVVSPELPHDHVPHAGGRYLGTLVEVLEARADVVVLVPDAPVNREAEAGAGLPSRYVVAGRRATRPPWLRGAFRVLTLADRARLRRDPSSLPWVVVAGLVTTRPAVAALRAADVVDLQWSHLVRLERLVRLLNRRARVIGTFHDVRSQRFRRAAAREGDPDLRPALERASRSEARAQARLVDRLDVAITFSEKDAHELADAPTSDRVTVVPPPLADLLPPGRAPGPHPTAVFVGHLARPENADAVTWLLDEVWPRVRQAVPDVRLRVVGGGAGAALGRRLTAEPGVEATGFVDDLAAEYRGAWLCVVPVRDGAGVKFKTVEAVVAGVPVVTTAVGAEGVAGPDRFAGFTEDAGEFAAACARVLLAPDAADAEAASTADWARERFSRTRFESSVERIYLRLE